MLPWINRGESQENADDEKPHRLARLGCRVLPAGTIRLRFRPPMRSIRWSAAILVGVALLSGCSDSPPTLRPPYSPPPTVDESPSPTVEKVSLPKLRGEEVTRARRQVRRLGLSVFIEEKPSRKPVGTVIGQHRLGRSVQLVVATDICQGYDPCIRPGPEVDCAGGTGGGPRYVNGPVYVSGPDPYGLDDDDDGVGCQG